MYFYKFNISFVWNKMGANSIGNDCSCLYPFSNSILFNGYRMSKIK